MADEHPTISTSRIDAGDVARHAFGTVRRGFDPHEVRAYLELLAGALDHAGRREQELLTELHEAEERARHPVIDESVLTSSLGQRSAAVLRGAHEEAARILTQAEEAAAAMTRDAQQQATDIQVNAESSAAERIAEAELEANSLRQQARDEVAVVLETARVEGEAVVERARDQGRSMLDQAQEARRRVLADMAHRRRLVTEQIELFRAARDEIAGSVVGVRRSLDRIVEELSQAEDSARAAASGAAKPHAVDVPESVLVDEGERALAELGESGGSEGAGGADGAGGAGGAERGEAAGEDARSRAEDAEDGRGEASETRPVLRFDDIATVVERAADVPAEVPAGVPAGVVDPAFPDRRDDPVPAGPSADPAVGSADVDGLFARLRAHHADDPPGPEEPAAGVAVAVAEAQVGTGTAGEDGVTRPDGDTEPSPDAGMFGRRADALDPITTTLARRLKRALQDDQNRLLDRLRQGTGEWSDELLVDEDSQREVYAKAATPSARDAMTAGADFARSIVGGRRPKSTAPDEHAVGAVSGELASTVVTLIRRRLVGGEMPDAAERIGAAYREWRGERIERLAEDSMVEAFSRGVLAGAGRRSLRWSRSEVGPGCADCEDNGLAGPVAPGDEFPTGHRHPPAHSGCRCLVLPTPG